MQFCRMYTGDDGKSHFEELDQSEGAKFFPSAPRAKALMFKNDQNRDDLQAGTTRRGANGASRCPAPARSASATARKKPSAPAMSFSPKT